MQLTAGAEISARIGQSLAPAFRAMAASLGPNARPVIYQGRSGVIEIAHGGAEIARRICSDSMAETLFKETVLEIERELGDGTARFSAMLEASFKVLHHQMISGASLRDLGQNVQLAQAEAQAAILRHATPLTDPRHVIGGFDLPEDLAAHLCDLHDEGLIQSEIRFTRGAQNGLRIGQGFALSASFATAAAQSYIGPHYLLVADEVIEDFKALAPVIEGFAKSDKTLVIVARGLTGSARQLIEVNQRAAVLRVFALTPEDVAERAVMVLEDLAAASGAVLLGGIGRPTLSEAGPACLGMAQALHLQRGLAVFEGVSGDTRLRMAQAEAEIQAKRHLSLDLQHARLRLARLQGKWAEITLSGREAPEYERRLRAAQAALRSAQISGVIASGAAGLAAIAADLGGEPWAKMAVAALRAPYARLCENGDPDTAPPADPAALSGALVSRALSFAAQLAGIGLVLRKL